MSDINKAAALARLAHRGQKYGKLDYYEGHIIPVVRACESNKHCTYGCLVVAYLHDIIEDSSCTLLDLHNFEFSSSVIANVGRLTRSKGESYNDYIDRIIRSGSMTAQFVKYHDVLCNIAACTATLRDLDATPMDRDWADRMLHARYVPTLEKLRAADPYFLYEGCRHES